MNDVTETTEHPMTQSEYAHMQQSQGAGFFVGVVIVIVMILLGRAIMSSPTLHKPITFGKRKDVP